MALGWESTAGSPLANKQEQVIGGQDLTQKELITGLKFQQPISVVLPVLVDGTLFLDQSGLGISWLSLKWFVYCKTFQSLHYVHEHCDSTGKGNSSHCHGLVMEFFLVHVSNSQN